MLNSNQYSGKTMVDHSDPGSTPITQEAGKRVTTFSVLFVIALIGLLYLSAMLQHWQLAPILPEANMMGEPVHPTQLEMHYQNMKSVRFGYALLYRFSLWTAVLIIALAMVVLGSVLIFDRVRENNRAGFTIQTRAEHPKFEFWSQMPGLVMVGLGSVILVATLAASGPLAPPIKMYDLPIFVPDSYLRQQADLPHLIVNDNSEEGDNLAEIKPSNENYEAVDFPEETE